MNYKLLTKPVKLPRTKKICRKIDYKLFQAKVLETENDHIKVHYVGCSNEFNEWKDKCDIENTLDENEDKATKPTKIITKNGLMAHHPYSLYNELGLTIKRSLTCSKISSLLIKIIMPFDNLLFNGGMRNAGIPSVKKGGVQHYELKNYSDLNHLLDNNWHYRRLHGNGDYGFVVLETVDFTHIKQDL